MIYKLRCIWNIILGRPTLYRVGLPWDADPTYPAMYDGLLDISNCNEGLVAVELRLESPRPSRATSTKEAG